MSQTAVKIPFTVASVAKCMCPRCPVQTDSKCVSSKLATITEALKAAPLKRDAIPGVYCASGTATCGDLDPKQACMCGSCAIFSQYDLANRSPVGKYCRDGSAK